ncbi:hypothetical protein PHYSODRAFT_335833 [Phytophthora sojae]|uniref:Uncharacterized protein n=1 Tax=Phytophthora sojae (strain P6497) TaxID=1094619 RepID=G4ZRY5_PHYSP|nr:hypothetical protein PHYSODRAFT_335833 [Phytophthora sojae]EGZ14164.1 hypothetical protein PHYSODRAFT_335833 [Phytophthora sojae]|eukprot:XP_009531593.1 hypothetical protein PHYSODRAFT_335833 [Phytophthora sojae]
MAEEDPFAEMDAMLAEQVRLRALPPKRTVRGVREFYLMHKPKEDDYVGVALCVAGIEDQPKLYRYNLVDAIFEGKEAGLKARMAKMDRAMRNTITLQVTMWKPRKRPLGGVRCPHRVGEVAVIGKVRKLQMYHSLLQGQVEAEDWMAEQERGL